MLGSSGTLTEMYMVAIIFTGIMAFIGFAIGYGFNFHTGKCPHCLNEIKVSAEAFSCPVCQKRVIFKDDKFYKV